jgi:hypothetical protein
LKHAIKKEIDKRIWEMVGSIEGSDMDNTAKTG